jgi:hypothetical protein
MSSFSMINDHGRWLFSFVSVTDLYQKKNSRRPAYRPRLLYHQFSSLPVFAGMVSTGIIRGIGVEILIGKAKGPFYLRYTSCLKDIFPSAYS